MEINDLIIKSLNYFDKQNSEYSKYIKNTYLIHTKNSIQIIDKNSNKILEAEAEVLGIFHHKTNVFLWGWLLPYLSIKETTIIRELLNYGLQLNPTSNSTEHFFLKPLLVNSRINIDSDIELNTIQAISAYLLRNKYRFIYPYTIKVSETNNDKFITTYYLVKNI